MSGTRIASRVAMAYAMTGSLSRLALRALCVVLGTGCGGGYAGPGCSSVELTDADACVDPWSGDEESPGDGDDLDLYIDCEDRTDCSASSGAFVRGTRFSYTVRASSSAASTRLEVESTDESVLSLTFDRTEQGDPCGGSILLEGTAELSGLGEAAIAVYDGDREIGRFDFSVHEADRLELMALVDDMDGGAPSEELQSIDALSIAAPVQVRMVLRNAAGEELAGASNLTWVISDPTVARIDDAQDSLPNEAIIVPVSAGRTTLHAGARGLGRDIPLEVIEQ